MPNSPSAQNLANRLAIAFEETAFCSLEIADRGAGEAAVVLTVTGTCASALVLIGCGVAAQPHSGQNRALAGIRELQALQVSDIEAPHVVQNFEEASPFSA